MNRFSPEVFADIYNKVPRLCTSVLIPSREHRGCVLVKRGIEPYKGSWHLPGGGVAKGESLKESAVRVAERELGIRFQPNDMQVVGFIECLGEPRDHEGIESMHNVDFVLSPHGALAPYEDLTLHAEEGEQARWFITEAPPVNEWHPLHVRWLLDKGFWWRPGLPEAVNWTQFFEDVQRKLFVMPDGDAKNLVQALYDVAQQLDQRLRVAGLTIDVMSKQLEVVVGTCASLQQTLNHSIAPSTPSLT